MGERAPEKGEEMRAADLVTAERTAMADLMEKLGPDAPTLCEGWTAADLAAHLVARDRRVDSMPGLVLGGPFARWTDKVRLGVKGRGFDSVLRMVRAGPPLWWKGPIAGVNVGEHFVHHEDVRRANGETESRLLDPALEEALWNGLRFTGRVVGRKLKGITLELHAPHGRSRTLGSGADTVTLTGAVGELVLYFSGRKDAAHVELDGSEAAVEMVRAARLGI
ncbi:MAG: TIGR03085 family metal-binding protein [Microbacteriaceae bacterium]